MNNLAALIADGQITVEELAGAQSLIERAQLVSDGIIACKKNIAIPVGVSEITCYSYMDRAGEYEAWGRCTKDGIFICYSNWGGNHEIGRCNLMDFKDVFMAFENQEFAHDLRRFLEEQIEKAKN